MNNLKLRRPFLFGLIVLVVSVNLVIIYLIATKNIALAPSDSAAVVDSRLNLSLVTDSTSTQIGERLNIALVAENPANANVAEVVLTFDPAILSAEKIIEDRDLLALNKKIDNTSGIVTVDLAYAGEGSFKNNSTLAIFSFSLKNKAIPSTTVALTDGTTLGIPNQLEAGELGILTININ